MVFVYKIAENNCCLRFFAELIQTEKRDATFLDKIRILTWRLLFISNLNFSCEHSYSKTYSSQNISYLFLSLQRFKHPQFCIKKYQWGIYVRMSVCVCVCLCLCVDDTYVMELTKEKNSIMTVNVLLQFNPYFANVPILYSLEITRKTKVLWCFQEV